MKLLQGPIMFREVLPSALIILMLGVILSIFGSSWQWFGALNWFAIPQGIVLGLVIYLIGFTLSCASWSKTKAMHDLLTTLHLLFRNFSWPQILAVSLLAGVGEELLVRAVLQSFLVNSVGVFWGIVCASLIFGLLHYMTKTYIVFTFALGLLFGLAFHYSNSIVLVMIGHTVYDIVAFAMIVKFPQMLGVESHDENKIVITESFG